MLYYSKQLENGRWGIFIQDQLVASIGCSDACQKIIDFLEQRLENRENQDFTTADTRNALVPYFHNMKLRP